MKRLEKDNYNTTEYYNKVLLDRFYETGLDYSDMWRVNDLLNRYSGGKLLDIGCGVCPLVNEAYKKYKDEVWGIDFADELIFELKVKYPELNYAICDFNNLLFRNEYFDYIILGEVIEHSENPKKLIKEAMRVLKKGGVLAISVPINETKENHTYKQHIWSFKEKDIIDLFGNVFYKKVIGNTFLCKVLK